MEKNMKICRILDRWIVILFTSMHYETLIVIGVISITPFLPKKMKIYMILDRWTIVSFTSMHYEALIIVGAFLTSTFLPQKMKLCKIPDRWTIILFTSMHYRPLIVIDAISIAPFLSQKMMQMWFFSCFGHFFDAFLGWLESWEFYYQLHQHKKNENESLFEPK